MAGTFSLSEPTIDPLGEKAMHHQQCHQQKEHEMALPLGRYSFNTFTFRDHHVVSCHVADCEPRESASLLLAGRQGVSRA